jgi:hypothetical protein
MLSRGQLSRRPGPQTMVDMLWGRRPIPVTNITWVAGSSQDLPGELGRFRLATMGRSFHWMVREQVLAPRSPPALR